MPVMDRAVLNSYLFDPKSMLSPLTESLPWWKQHLATKKKEKMPSGPGTLVNAKYMKMCSGYSGDLGEGGWQMECPSD